MICQKKQKFLYFGLSLFICVYSVLCSSIGSYASGGAGHGYNWTASEQIAHWTSSIGDVAGYAKDWAFNKGTWDSVKTAVFDAQALKAQEAQMSYDDWVLSNTSWYYKEGSEYQNESTLDHITMSQEMADCFNTTINNYVQQNPLSYHLVKIPPYSYMSTESFTSYGVYQTYQQFCKNHPDSYILINYLTDGTNVGGQWTRGLALVVPKSSNFGLYGTVSASGNFNNVHGIYNWATSPPSGSTEFKLYRFDGSQWNDMSWSDAYQLYNTLQLGGTRQRYNILNMYSTLNKYENVYVFDTVNAFKAYNAGVAQPYYLGSNFDNIVTTIPASVTDGSYNSSNYNNIVNSVQSGWSAQEVLDLVDRVLDGNGSGSGGGGSGSGSSNNPFDFLGSIGEAVGKLVGGIGDFISGIIGGIVDAILDLINMFVGEDGILNKLTSLINTGFNTFLGDMFSWLPSEVVTCFTACLLVGIFFAIWKIIRG